MHTDSFHEDGVIATALAEDHRFVSGSRHTPEVASVWRGPNEGVGLPGESGHAGLVGEEGAPRGGRGGVDCEHGDLVVPTEGGQLIGGGAFVPRYPASQTTAQCLDEGTFARSWGSGETLMEKGERWVIISGKSQFAFGEEA